MILKATFSLIQFSEELLKINIILHRRERGAGSRSPLWEEGLVVGPAAV